MLAVLGGIVLVVIGVILAINAYNNAETKRIIEETPPDPPRPLYDWSSAGDDSQCNRGRGNPDDYDPTGFIVGAVLCFIAALILFCIA